MNTAAGSARISGWDIIGKTGTTDADKDSWFCGMSPYATLAIWTGFDYPHTISNTNVATNTFNKVMSSYLSGMEHKDFKFPSNLIEAQYNPYSGLIVSTENVSGKYVGYYTEDNMPSNGGWDGYYDSSNPDYDDYDYDTSSGGSDSSYSGEESNSGGGDTSSAESQGGDTSSAESQGGGDTSSAESQGGGEEPKPEESGGDASASAA